MLSRTIFAFSLFLAIAGTACSVPEESGPVDETAGTDADMVVTDTAAEKDMVDDMDTMDTVTVDNDQPDPTDQSDQSDQSDVSDDIVSDTAAPDADTATTGEGAYQQCDPGVVGSCPSPMNCVKGYDDAQYGQCLLGCNINEDCPPPPDPATMQVACDENQKVCLILCGAFQSDCPDWLECYSQQMCLPPSTVTATKGPGEVCAGKDDCLGDSDCIEGSSGIPHCYPLCSPSVPNDCAAKAPGYQAQCQDAGGFGFCMFTCQGGVPCPGDLTCVAGTFCQG